MKVMVAVGTRPEVIKMAPVITALANRGIPATVVGTGQHTDWKMLGSFLETFGIHLDHKLELKSRDLLGSFVTIMSGLGALIARLQPKLVLAVGDTTTVTAAAFAARKTGSAFGHVEAGLRAFSRELPEEEHRICADALADMLFAPTRVAHENLVRERVNGTVHLTGNTILDALLSHPPAPRSRASSSPCTVKRRSTTPRSSLRSWAQSVSSLGTTPSSGPSTPARRPR